MFHQLWSRKSIGIQIQSELYSNSDKLRSDTCRQLLLITTIDNFIATTSAIIVVPIALILIIFPILRVTALINSIVASGKLKGEKNPKTNMIVAGVFQILDAVATWLFEGFLIALVLAIMIYNGTMSNYVTQFIPNATDQIIQNIVQVAKYIIMIPVLIKSALQIISAIRLFIQAKK